MNILIELTYILGFSFLGQTISKTTGIPVPGSVIGLILFFLSLQFKIIKLEGVEKTSNFLTDNLAILFIHAGVAIISNFNKEYLGFTCYYLFYFNNNFFNFCWKINSTFN